MKKLALALAITSISTQAVALGFEPSFAGLDLPFEPPFADPGHIELTYYNTPYIPRGQEVSTFNIYLANIGTGNPGDFSYSADWTFYANTGYILAQNVVCTDLDTTSSFCGSNIMGGFQNEGAYIDVDVYDTITQLPLIGPTSSAFDIRWTGVTDSGVFDWKITMASQLCPVPAAAWFFGSALIGLAGVKRRN